MDVQDSKDEKAYGETVPNQSNSGDNSDAGWTTLVARSPKTPIPEKILVSDNQQNDQNKTNPFSLLAYLDDDEGDVNEFQSQDNIGELEQSMESYAQTDTTTDSSPKKKESEMGKFLNYKDRKYCLKGWATINRTAKDILLVEAKGDKNSYPHRYDPMRSIQIFDKYHHQSSKVKRTPKTPLSTNHVPHAPRSHHPAMTSNHQSLTTASILSK